MDLEVVWGEISSESLEFRLRVDGPSEIEQLRAAVEPVVTRWFQDRMIPAPEIGGCFLSDLAFIDEGDHLEAEWWVDMGSRPPELLYELLDELKDTFQRLGDGSARLLIE